MSDTETQNFTASGSGKSPEEVAFDLLNKLKGQGVWGERNIADILDMYAECLDAAKGLRAYTGQTRIDAPVKTGGMQPQATQAATQSAPVHAQAQLQQAQVQAQAQLQHQAPQQVQTVQAQQHALQQAFKQG